MKSGGTQRLTTLTLLLHLVFLCARCPARKSEVKFPESQRKYLKAIELLVTGNYLEAVKKFEELANTSPNPLIAELSFLRLADSLFMQGKYAESAEVYREFSERYPRSVNIAYAAYRKGLCHFKQIPEDVWILPPAESREQSHLEEACSTFKNLLAKYPTSIYALASKVLLKVCVTRMCKHDIYVANYYWKRDKYRAVVMRLEQALSRELNEIRNGRISSSLVCARSLETMQRLANAYYYLKDIKGLARLKTMILQQDLLSLVKAKLGHHIHLLIAKLVQTDNIQRNSNRPHKGGKK